MVVRITMSGVKLYIIDTESVINEVQVRECLWNSRAESYKSKEAKKLAWEQICKLVSPCYESSTLAEKKQIVKAVQARWKTARDAYMKCRTYTGKNKYVFFNQLRFLEHAKNFDDSTSDNQPGTSSQNNDEEDPLATEEEEEEESTVEPKMTSRPRPTWQKKRKRNLTGLETQLLKIMRNNTNSSASANTNSQVLQEDDQSFFNSLAPIINDFDKYKKLVFRSRILELAMEIGDIQSSAKQNHHSYIVGKEDSE